MTELLSPAGNREKLESAIRYGADAVYLSGKAFGMRSAAGNFDFEEIEAAIAYAHERNVLVYLTVNVMPRTSEYAALRAYLERFRNTAPPDALIISDLGVLFLAKEILPHVPIHISTQANTVSAQTCRAFHSLGASRVVLARELTLDEIRAIRTDTPDTLQLEAFVHGSMCMAYSGRCLLSGFFTGRDANRGMCTQPCRWQYRIRETNYEIVEEKRPELPIPILESEGEAFFMSSKDTCMIEHVPALIEAGIDSFKIEGRMKSAYYAAVVTNTYRMAIDAAKKGEPYDPRWMRELESVSHRPYHTGYYFDHSTEEANTTDNPGYIKENAYLAIVTGYDPASGRATLLQRNKFSTGDTVEILTPGKFGERIEVTALYGADGEEIPSVPHPQMLFMMPVPHPVLVGDIVRACEKGE